jgi:hypothetical protein
MQKHKRIRIIVGIVIGLLPWSGVSAADEPGPWLCTPTEEITCVETGECDTDAFESLNLPPFIKIDLVAKQMSGADEGITEAAGVERVERVDGRVILQGVQHGRGWSMVIVEESGNMTLSVSGEDDAWVAFGDCEPLASWMKGGVPAGASTTEPPGE